jgi:hypothetical protein
MSGFQEILLIVVILLAIFFIPRMTARNAAPASRRHAPPIRANLRRFPPLLSVRQRLAVLASVVWLCGTLLYFRPWAGDWVLFGAVGALPLIIAWGIYWVIADQRR